MMKKLTIAWSPVSLLGWMLLFAFPVQAEEPAGKAAAVVGEVTVVGSSGDIREIRRNTPFFAGDIISTGPNSRVRLVFSDNSIVALRPSSRLVIDEFMHTGDSQVDKSSLSLLRGGFRAVTGAIGQARKANHQIATPVATIGIRGTDHEARYCAGDCVDLIDIGVDAPPDGLYTGTNAGQTVVGDQYFSAGEYGYTDPGGSTIPLLEAPQILAADPELRIDLKEPAEVPGERAPGPTDKTDQSEPTSESAPSPTKDDLLEIPAQPQSVRAVPCL
ncbi:FecR family protein [Thiohalomonas denitrificans]|uniref:FecR family protein n=1 Tax=Thiohalomonas denitrificans TaxID=415747 RepID=A0A1G5Q2P0_9GAMM|nr:FecR family protein [Thiohalomonas denitrificans]SCZ56134.1 FecR family protein [Thiohalomonas denitrificans]